MKSLGAVLILCGASMLCVSLLGAKRRERETLCELAAALEGLEREVRVSRVPLPRLLAQGGRGEHADAFFASVLALRKEKADTPLPACWRAAAHTLPLRSGERESLARLADALGSEEEDLLRALRFSSEELRTALEMRERESAQDRRIIPTLCFSLGVLLTVLLA